MRRNNVFWGLILILIGVFALLNKVLNIQFFSMDNFWPLFVLVPGLMFELGYFTTRRNPGVLVPGGILTTIGLLFFFETFTNWSFSEYTWPVYPFSVAVGLFQLYLFDRRQPGLLIPVFIIGGFSVISLLTILFGNVVSWLNYSLIFPVLLIVLGIYILFRNTTKR